MNQSKFTPNPVYYHTPIKRGFMKIGNGDYKDTRSPKGRCQKKKQDFMGISLPPSVQKFWSTNNRFLESTASLKRDCVNVYIVYKHGLPRERRMLIQAGAEYHEAPRRHRGSSKMNNDFHL